MRCGWSFRVGVAPSKGLKYNPSMAFFRFFRPWRWLWIGGWLVLAACGPLVHETATPTPATPSPTPTAIPTSTPTPTPIPPLFLPAEDPPTPLPRSTPLPSESLTCDHRIQFVADVTIPDDTSLRAGAVFTKTWRLKNAGTCAWTPAYRLVFVRGDAMNGQDSQPLGAAVPPGGITDVSVRLQAPDQPGNYAGEWMLETPAGKRFGLGDDGQTPFWVRIRVP